MTPGGWSTRDQAEASPVRTRSMRSVCGAWSAPVARRWPSTCSMSPHDHDHHPAAMAGDPPCHYLRGAPRVCRWVPSRNGVPVRDRHRRRPPPAKWTVSRSLEGGTMELRAAKRLFGLVIVAALAAAVPTGLAQAGTGTFNVRDFGATGNGSTLDDDAIDRAINAASSGAGGGVVLFPAGTYRSRSIHLKSNITLQLATGATIRVAGSGFDAADPNTFSRFQDFGHSHFHNTLMWGENVSNITLTGTGTIDGDGLTTDNAVPAGVGDKILSLKLCANITLRDVTFRRGGHFAILTNGCHDVLL